MVGSRLDRVSCRQGSNVVSGCCTTRLENTHGTEIRELLYPWHPWFALWVAVHEAVDKSDGVVFRCGLTIGLRRDAYCDRCPCRSGGAHNACDAAAACTERPFCTIECPVFGRIKTLSRPESGRGLCHARRH